MTTEEGKQRSLSVWIAVARTTGQLLEVEERKADLSDKRIWERRAGPVDFYRATLSFKGRP